MGGVGDSGHGASSGHLRGAMWSMDPAYVEHGSRVPLEFQAAALSILAESRPSPEHYRQIGGGPHNVKLLEGMADSLSRSSVLIAIFMSARKVSPRPGLQAHELSWQFSEA